jgi:hypothetical protein
MSVNGGSAVSRQFVAFSPSISTQVNEFVNGKRKGIFYVVYTVLAAAVFAFTMFKSLRPWMPWGLGIVIPIIVFGPLIWLAYLWSRSRRKVLIDVTSDGLTVNQLPGIVFSLAEAQLGPWTTMGVALHLKSDSHQFVLGGRDRVISPSTRLDAPAVPAVDAWLRAAEFDEILAVGGGRNAVDRRAPGLAEPIRCLLFPNPYLAEEFGSFAFRKHLQFQRSLAQPSMFFDVDDGAIRLIDPNTDALSASAPLAQVTVTPATFQPDSVTSGDGSTYDYPAITGLVVALPGTQPLTIGCVDSVGLEFRFSWRENVARPNERPAYVVSAGDWLMLVERFGLAAHLKEKR